MYVLIILAEPFQRNVDEPDENDEGVLDPRNEEDFGIEESEIDEVEDENDDSERKNIAKDPRRKCSHNIIQILFFLHKTLLLLLLLLLILYLKLT